MEERRCRRKWNLLHHLGVETKASMTMVVMEDVREIQHQCLFLTSYFEQF